MIHCNQCGFDWSPRVSNPKACTRCKRYDWSEPKKGLSRGVESRVVGIITDRTRVESGKSYRSELAGRGGIGIEDRSMPVDIGIDEDEVRVTPSCRACEKPMRVRNGFWYCTDLSGCSLGGEHQGRV